MKIDSGVSIAHSLKEKVNKERTWLFIIGLPFIILTFIFNYLPLAGWLLAFFDYKLGMPILQSHFAGLKYFSVIFQNFPDVKNALVNTLVFYFLNLLTYPIPVIFAIMLSEVKNGFLKRLTQTVATLPNFVSWVIVFSITFSLFSTDGMLNLLLTNMNLIKNPINLLGNESAVYLFQTLLNLWKSLGWSAIVYLAAISGIDGELYDAASVDGAGRLRRIMHILIPGIAPTFFVMLILGISNLLSVGFEQYLVFYNGLVADKISVLDIYVYRLAILNSQIPYATAIGILKTIISIGLLFFASSLSKKVRGYGIV